MQAGSSFTRVFIIFYGTRECLTHKRLSLHKELNAIKLNISRILDRTRFP